MSYATVAASGTSPSYVLRRLRRYTKTGWTFWLWASAEIIKIVLVMKAWCRWWLGRGGGGGGRGRIFLKGGAGRAASFLAIWFPQCKLCRRPWRSSGAVLGVSAVEVLQLQFIDRVRPSRCEQRQVPTGVPVLGQVVGEPELCNDRCSKGAVYRKGR